MEQGFEVPVPKNVHLRSVWPLFSPATVNKAGGKLGPACLSVCHSSTLNKPDSKCPDRTTVSTPSLPHNIVGKKQVECSLLEAGLAQLVEQRTCNAKVRGSTPLAGTTSRTAVPQRRRNPPASRPGGFFIAYSPYRFFQPRSVCLKRSLML